MRGPTSPGAPRTSHYDVLQVSPHASPEVIQAAYRVLARENHPDVNPSVEAARRMLQVNAAYDILSDSQRRAQYDLQLARTSRVVTARPVAVTSPIRRIAPARPTAWT